MTWVNYISSFARMFIVCSILAGCSELHIDDDADRSIAVMGDVRSGYGTYEELLNVANSIDPAPRALIVTGDIINTPGNVFEWLEFWRVSDTLSGEIPLYTAVGNHDVRDMSSQDIYRDNVRMPGNECYYGFDIGECRCIVLDTEVPGEENGILGDQYAWLEDELAMSQARPDIAVIALFLHRPFYSRGASHGGDSLVNAAQVHALLETFGKVKMVIESHDHEFYHYNENGIVHIVSGGGGAPLRSNTSGEYFHLMRLGFYDGSARINCKTFDVFGEKIEDFDL